jgi:hypothetical protein
VEADVIALWITTIGFIITALVTAAYAPPGPKKSGTIATASVLTVVCFILAVVGTVGSPSPPVPPNGPTAGPTTEPLAAPTATNPPAAPRVTEVADSPAPEPREAIIAYEVLSQDSVNSSQVSKDVFKLRQGNKTYGVAIDFKILGGSGQISSGCTNSWIVKDLNTGDTVDSGSQTCGAYDVTFRPPGRYEVQSEVYVPSLDAHASDTWQFTVTA